MTRSSRIHTLRAKLGIPSVGEVEYSQQWDALPNNVIRFGDRVAIRSCDGTFWQANLENNTRVMSIHRHIQGWEKWQVVHVNDELVARQNRPVCYGDHITFRSLANGMFVGTNFDTDVFELAVAVPIVKEWEWFEIMVHPAKPPIHADNRLRFGSWFCLRSYHLTHVMLDRDDTRQLLAIAQVPDEWELFAFVRPIEEIDT